MKFSEFLKKRWFVILIALIVLVGGTVAAITLIGGQDDETLSDKTDDNDQEDIDSPKERIRLNLSALLSDNTGVKTESGFKLTFPKGAKLDTETVKQGFEVIPAFDFDMEKADDGFVIKPKAFLQANKVYTFKVNLPEQNIKESWAFQTRREFKVVSTLPGHKGTNVPLNSGIEITFSHTGIQDFEKNFTIEPKVEGRFEIHENIAVFVPKALKADTIYKVTVHKGVSQGDSKETLKDDVTFSFQTQTNIPPQNNDQPYLSVYNWLYNFPSDIQPVLEISASDDFKEKDLEVSLYRYDTPEAFIKDYDAIANHPEWVIIDRNRHIPDVSGLLPYKSYTLPLSYTPDSYYMSYLALPENLAEGHYLIILKSDDLKEYAFIQINDMQLYMTVGDEKSLIWVNDMITGQPVSGAIFEGNGIKSVTTGNDGTALIGEDLDEGESGSTICYKASRNGHPTLVAPITNGRSYWTNSSQTTDYKSNWNYLYLDRGTYLPTDTVKAWGILRPRSMEAPPQKVTVKLIKNLYDYETYTYNKQVLDTREVALTPKGTYTTEFSFENLPTDHYDIEVEAEGIIVSDSYFFINKYVKSQYIVSADTENKAYFAGETLKVQVGCEFFEGTPVPGFNLSYIVRNYSDYMNAGKGDLTLDSQGEGAISLTLPNEAGPVSWQPLYHSLYVNNKDPEETEVSDSEYFTVFPRDVMIQTNVDFNDGSANLNFKTNVIDLSAIRKTGEVYSGGDDPLYKGGTIDRKLTATLYERYWDKKETGEYYDMILKQSVKTYEYFEVKNAIEHFEVQTVGGSADYKLIIPNYSGRKSYFIVYQTSDTKQRPIEETVYLYGDYYWSNYSEDYYYLEFEDKEVSYKVGEPINFTLMKNNNDPINGGNILYMVHQEGVKEFWTSQNVDQTHVFIEDYIPNAYVQAVYFDGKQLHTAYERLVRFDHSDKVLDLTLETDKESYKPGEKVNATITVKDKTGKPVEADVCLSVVDEAYFALYEQEVETSSSLYRSVYDPGIRDTYISYRKIVRGSNGAEGGEGDDEGGNGVRKNFVDSAFFKTAQTNSKGQAELSFTLPDNLTSWRLTYQAVTDDLKAGNGQHNMTTRLPFFVKAVLNDTFMLGDAPTLLLKGYGEKVKAEDEVAFKVTLKNERGEMPVIEAKGKIGEFTEITLPNLDEGVYAVIVEGNSGGLRDAVEKTIQVRKSQLLAKQVDYHTLTKDLKLEIESYATLSFYNAELDDYYRSLTDLYWSYGSRLDQIVAQSVAQDLIKQYFPDDWYANGEKNDISPYQKEDGGFALLPYGSSEVELTAKIAALGVEGADSNRLSDYFKGIISDPATTPLQVSAAYWGLASLREPVLLELQGFMEEGDLTLDEKLYLANALAQLGDLASAEKLYEQITKAYSKEMAPYRYIDEGSGSKENILRWTSLTAMLAVNVDAKDKMAYFKYIEQVSSDEILINLERLILVKQGLPGAFNNKTSRFLLELDGKKETVKLEGTKPYTVMVSPDKLKTMKFSNIKGDIALSVSYESAQDPSNYKNSIATVNRTYNRKEGFPVNLNRLDVVTVELRIDFDKAAPEGYYEVTDVLPAGLRYINPYEYAEDIYFGEPEGQRVKLGCYYDGTEDVETIRYRARVVAPGEYTADHALVKHSDSDARGYSQKMSVLIN